MKLSIITVNYNNRDGLQRTIDSVIAQTWRNFEWVVIDGGSTDGSKELIEKYQNHFIYWCSEPDKGVYNAMNKGIAKAKGEYLIFMNSGDCFAGKDVLKKVFSYPHTADIITGGVKRKDNGQLIRRYEENILLQIYTNTINHQGSFIRKTLFQGLLYDESLKIVSDWKFWVETIVFGNAKVQVLDDVIAIQDVDGISATNVTLLKRERNSVMDDLFSSNLQSFFNEFRDLKRSVYYLRIIYLKRNSPFLYSLSRKVLALFLLMKGVTNKKLINSHFS